MDKTKTNNKKVLPNLCTDKLWGRKWTSRYFWENLVNGTAEDLNQVCLNYFSSFIDHHKSLSFFTWDQLSTDPVRTQSVAHVGWLGCWLSPIFAVYFHCSLVHTVSFDNLLANTNCSETLLGFSLWFCWRHPTANHSSSFCWYEFS